MLVAAGRMSGKRLVTAIKRELDATGVSAVAVMSEMGAIKTRNAIQRVANETGRRINALPTEDVLNSRNVMVVVVTYEPDETAVTG